MNKRGDAWWGNYANSIKNDSGGIAAVILLDEDRSPIVTISERQYADLHDKAGYEMYSNYDELHASILNGALQITSEDDPFLVGFLEEL